MHQGSKKKRNMQERRNEKRTIDRQDIGTRKQLDKRIGRDNKIDKKRAKQEEGANQ